MSARRRPWRVHVREIGPNFSFSHEGAARACAERLVSGEEWDGGSKGLIGNYREVIVCNHDGFDRGAGVLLRRTVYSHAKARVDEVFPLGGCGWEKVS